VQNNRTSSLSLAPQNKNQTQPNSQQANSIGIKRLEVLEELKEGQDEEDNQR